VSVVDPRFSLANERTYLAWVRTGLALVAGGLIAAKVGDFGSEAWRWAVSGPPIAGGAAAVVAARGRWRRYEAAMRAGEPLPVGAGTTLITVATAAYAVLVLLALALD
jgi:putative membrane protein